MLRPVNGTVRIRTNRVPSVVLANALLLEGKKTERAPLIEPPLWSSTVMLVASLDMRGKGGKVEEANSFIAKKIIIDRAAEIILCN